MAFVIDAFARRIVGWRMSSTMRTDFVLDALEQALYERRRGLIHHSDRGSQLVYGVRKVWRQLNREGIAVARCTVGRLMHRLDLRGVVRGKRVRTTVPDAAAACPLDKVQRLFQAERPNQLWVSDFTYVSTWQGFV